MKRSLFSLFFLQFHISSSEKNTGRKSLCCSHWMPEFLPPAFLLYSFSVNSPPYLLVLYFSSSPSLTPHFLFSFHPQLLSSFSSSPFLMKLRWPEESHPAITEHTSPSSTAPWQLHMLQKSPPATGIGFQEVPPRSWPPDGISWQINNWPPGNSRRQTALLAFTNTRS